jgi:hypothetical protein
MFPPPPNIVMYCNILFIQKAINSLKREREFRQLLRDLKELREIRFPRCVQPLVGQFRNPMLLVFGDGSREAYCTLAYLRWERDDGTACCFLVTGKTQEPPRLK